MMPTAQNPPPSSPQGRSCHFAGSIWIRVQRRMQSKSIADSEERIISRSSARGSGRHTSTVIRDASIRLQPAANVLRSRGTSEVPFELPPLELLEVGGLGQEEEFVE